MNATYRPIRCPHGTELGSVAARQGIPVTVAAYEDGCRATSGAPVRFWCGPDEMSKPNGVSITEGEYLRDWQDAIDEAFFRREAETNPEPVGTDEDARAEYRGVWGDSAEHAEHLDAPNYDDATWRYNNSREHAEYLGEVPWSDRVED